jgi:hypothetical protein
MGDTWKALGDELLAAHTRFIEVAVKLDVRLRSELGVCGAWSPKEVVAHLVGWDAEAVRGFGMLVSDQMDVFVPVDNDAIDVFNAQSVEARRDLSWDAVMGELKTTQQDLQQLIRVVDGKGFNSAGGFGNWLIGRREDYEYHTEQLLAWVD